LLWVFQVCGAWVRGVPEVQVRVWGDFSDRVRSWCSAFSLWCGVNGWVLWWSGMLRLLRVRMKVVARWQELLSVMTWVMRVMVWVAKNARVRVMEAIVVVVFSSGRCSV
jgi:hypothetical protein